MDMESGNGFRISKLRVRLHGCSPSIYEQPVSRIFHGKLVGCEGESAELWIVALFVEENLRERG